MNPYEELNVNEGASDKEIKEAYRNLARKHHPDIGGDPHKFSKASCAYALIKTEPLRKKYKKHGEAHPQTLRLQAISLISTIFLKQIQQIAKTDIENLKYKNLVANVKSEIESQKSQVIKNYKNIKISITSLEDVINRIENKGKEEDFFSHTLRAEIEGLHITKEKVRRTLQVIYKSSKLLKDFDYRNEIRSYGYAPTTFTYTTAG